MTPQKASGNQGDDMTNRRMMTLIRCSMERAINVNKMREAAQSLGALVLVQKDLILELERENAHLRLQARYQRTKIA
jgi:hypothetical protein